MRGDRTADCLGMPVEWIAAAVVAALLTLAAAWLSWRRARIRPGAMAELRFQLELPSRWAAELTARVLESGGHRCELGDGSEWSCAVIRSATYQPAQVQKLGSEFHRIAAARGGSCSRIEVRSGSLCEVVTLRA